MNATKAILMVILLALGSFYLYSEKRPAAEEEGVKAVALFPNLTQDKVTGFEVIDDDSRVKLERQDDGGWGIATASNAKPDESVVEDWLYGVASLDSHNSLDAEELSSKLVDFGLNPPEFKVVVSWDGAEEELHFGKPHAFSGRRYLLLPKRNLIAMVDQASADKLEKSTFDFRKKTPYLGFNEGISSVNIQPQGNEAIFLSKVDERWGYEFQGKRQLAEDVLLERFLRTLAQLPVVGFHPYSSSSLKILGLEEPEVRLEISGENGSKEFSFWKAETEKGARYFAWLHGDSWMHEYQGPFYAMLLEPSYYFRDKAPFDEIPIKQLVGVRVRDFKELGKEYSIAQVKRAEFGKVWAITDGTKKAWVTDKDVAVPWLKELLGLRVLSYSLPGSRSSEISGGPEKSFDILYVENEVSKSYHLVVSGTVSEASNSDSGKSSNQDAPRYGTIRSGDGKEVVPVIISGAAWVVLDKELKDFLPVEGAKELK